MQKDDTLKKVVGSDDKHTLWGYYRTLNIVCFIRRRSCWETAKWQRRWRDDEEGRWRNNLDVDFSSAECKDLCAAQTHRKSICPWLQTLSLMTSFTADVSLMLVVWWQNENVCFPAAHGKKISSVFKIDVQKLAHNYRRSVTRCKWACGRGSEVKVVYIWGVHPLGSSWTTGCEVSGFFAYMWSWDKIKSIIRDAERWVGVLPLQLGEALCRAPLLVTFPHGFMPDVVMAHFSAKKRRRNEMKKRVVHLLSKSLTALNELNAVTSGWGGRLRRNTPLIPDRRQVIDLLKVMWSSLCRRSAADSEQIDGVFKASVFVLNDEWKSLEYPLAASRRSPLCI